MADKRRQGTHALNMNKMTAPAYNVMKSAESRIQNSQNKRGSSAEDIRGGHESSNLSQWLAPLPKVTRAQAKDSRKTH